MSVRLKLFGGAIAAALLSTALVGGAPNASAAPTLYCDNTADTPLTGDHPKLRVVVQEGDSCYIENALIFSLTGYEPENVYLLGTSLGHGVEHNIMIRGATGTVKIGSHDCGWDPKVGNNIEVRDSNNVLICMMSVDNNIIVTGNHGEITVSRSVACDNITVSRNLPYDGPYDTLNPDVIRMFRLKAANHIRAVDNADREVRMRNNVEDFMSPSACRASLK